jgi:Domain of unknown function (DUF4123)
VDDFYPDRRTIERFRFGLVDASLRSDLPDSWERQVIAPAFLGSDTDRCPVLVDLLAIPDDERTQWCDLVHQQVLAGDEAHMSLLLEASCGAAVLASHLAKRLEIRLQAQDRPRQFRYFDPGTFLQLPRILGNDGMAWLLGPINAVQVPWAGQWTEVRRSDVNFNRPFQLNLAHMDAILRVGIINRVSAYLPPALDARSWVRQTAELDALVLRGRERHHLSQRDDLVAFARDVCLHHQRIDEHPRLHSLFEHLRNAKPEDELDYRELSSRLMPEDWAAMVADLEQQTQEGMSP